ncbi:hypothetical protein HGRIS_003683 [Hohenbuehelia grisea]|uniref:Cytochrome c oxidase subunit n=1 Tax=Hohenbuehelia grisea TaxID=104357 RepID=A0ABR3JHW8_9AGAR
MSDTEATSKYVLQTVGFDARFPNTNQTRHCFQTYCDYFKCVAAKGDDFAPCKQFKRAYNSLCPNEWVCFDREVYPFILTPCRRSASGMTNGRMALSPPRSSLEASRLLALLYVIDKTRAHLYK